MYNKYPLDLKSCIKKGSARFRSENPEFSQRLDEIGIPTQDDDENDDEAEEVGKPATKGVCVDFFELFYY